MWINHTLSSKEGVKKDARSQKNSQLIPALRKVEPKPSTLHANALSIKPHALYVILIEISLLQ